MNRAELERLDRDTLIDRAEAAGVTRARILTRPELVDELLLRSGADESTTRRARGFFGRARDLLASVVERGLHLPDAADRIRTLGGGSVPPPRGAPAALPTVTLAEIYAAQGHRDRAIETLRGVLSREPDHAAARLLLDQLEDRDYPVPPPKLPPEAEEASASAGWTPEGQGTSASPYAARGADPLPAEPTHVLDDAPLPPRYDVDECVAIPVDPRTLYVYWEVRQRTLEYLRATRSEGVVTLRLLVVVPTWDGPRSTTVDHPAGEPLSDFFARDLPPGCVVRAAVGWKQGDTFLPIAHSPALETPPGAPSPIVADALVRWTPEGARPVSREDGDAAAIARTLDRLRREAGRAWRREPRADGVGIALDEAGGPFEQAPSS
jgi:hypothetical protein